MIQKAIRASLSLWLLSAPVLASAQEPTVYKLPPPRIACDAASGLRDQSGNVVPGSLRKRCDVLWNRSLQDGGVGGWRYDDFMSQCAQSCPAPAPLSQASSVPQLNTLGTQAAQSASGGGLNTALLVGGGVALAVGIGLAASNGSPGPNDQPASP
jgi:hypothetical protein